MVEYKCFNCGKKLDHTDLQQRFVCPDCGSKIFFKPRNRTKKVKTD